jgi:hypothetical protein
MDHNPAKPIADLRGLGIGLHKSGNRIQADPDLPPEYLPVLRRRYDEIAHGR